MGSPTLTTPARNLLGVVLGSSGTELANNLDAVNQIAGTASTNTSGAGASLTALAAASTSIVDLTLTATTGSFPTTTGAVAISNTASPTVVELLRFCCELNASLNTVLAALQSV